VPTGIRTVSPLSATRFGSKFVLEFVNPERRHFCSAGQSKKYKRFRDLNWVFLTTLESVSRAIAKKFAKRRKIKIDN
jgi:hypothetical protein